MRTSFLRLTRHAAMMLVMIGAVAGFGRLPVFAQQTPPVAPSSPMAPAAPAATPPAATEPAPPAPSTTPEAPAPSTATPAAPSAPATPAAASTPETPAAAATAAPAAPEAPAATPAGSAETALTQALSSYEKQDFASAADALKQAIAANPSSVEAHYYLGYALYKLKRFDESRVAFQQAYQLRSDYLPPVGPAKTK